MKSCPSNAKQIFLDALEHSGADRTAFVAEACGGDATLDRRVRELLDAHDQSENLLSWVRKRSANPLRTESHHLHNSSPRLVRRVPRCL